MTLQSVTASGPPRRYAAGPGLAPADSCSPRRPLRENDQPSEQRVRNATEPEWNVSLTHSITRVRVGFSRS
jgi:hypothetical protein